MAAPDLTQAPSSDFTLMRLRASGEPAFGELLTLYQQAFPDTERKPLAALHGMLAEEQYHFLLATENGHTAGFAILRTLNGNAALLEYMAVVPALRVRGLGSRIVSGAAQAAGAPPAALLIEVESDRNETPDRAQRTRRKRFYRGLGARELHNLTWLMPPQTAAPPPPMELLLLGPTSDSVSRTQLQRWLSSIYTEVYGQSADDPRLHTMLAALPESVLLI